MSAVVKDLLTDEQREERDLEAKVEAARAARDELEKKNEGRRRLERLREEAAAEERGLFEAQKLIELEAAHGPLGKAIRRVNTSEGMIVVKKPNHVLFQKYQDKGATDTEALQKLVRPCLVYPDKASFDRICEEAPASLLKCANAVCALAGIGREEIAGK